MFSLAESKPLIMIYFCRFGWQQIIHIYFWPLCLDWLPGDQSHFSSAPIAVKGDWITLLNLPLPRWPGQFTSLCRVPSLHVTYFNLFTRSNFPYFNFTPISSFFLLFHLFYSSQLFFSTPFYFSRAYRPLMSPISTLFYPFQLFIPISTFLTTSTIFSNPTYFFFRILTLQERRKRVWGTLCSVRGKGKGKGRRARDHNKGKGRLLTEVEG